MTKPRTRRVTAPFARSAATAAASSPPAPLAAPPPEDDFGFALPDYDPADYRWVPVRRQPRYDGWTEEKQRKFIEVLADTGLVGRAAKAVGMTRMSAYRLRRATHAAAFARAWDRAREQAGAMIEDIAFERAIDGVEVETYGSDGALLATRTVYNDRLLTFLLRHLRPEIYSAAARERRGGAWSERGSERESGPENGEAETARASLDAALRAMEPQLPAPVAALVDPEQLASDLLLAEIADGTLPHFNAEQRPPRTPEQIRTADLAAQRARGEIADRKQARGETLSAAEMADWCAWIDPATAAEDYDKSQQARHKRNDAD